MQEAAKQGGLSLGTAVMGIRPYIGFVIWAVVLWVVAVLAVYGIIYVIFGVKFWHPLG